MVTHHHRPLALLLALLLVACGVAEPPRSAPNSTPTPGPVIRVRPGGVSGVPLPTPTVPPTAVPTPDRAAYPLDYPWPITATPTLDPTAEEATIIAELEGPRNLPYQTPVPQGPLLRIRWPAPTADTAVHTLIASRGEPTSFWAFDLRDPSQRREIYRPPIEPFALFPAWGELSPDGAWIAYLAKDGDGYDLRVVRSDGKDDRLVAQNVGNLHHPCSRIFAWSPDGSQLAYRSFRRGPNGWAIVELYRYMPATGTAPDHLGDVFGTQPIGWTDANRLLLLVAVDPVAPLQLEAVDVTTTQREVLGVAPTSEELSCPQLAPNRQFVLLRSAHRDYRVDLATRTWQEFELDMVETVWGPTSHDLLDVPSRGDAPVLLFDLERPTMPLTLTLMPAYTAQSSFGLLGGSPDGQYLLLCENDGKVPINRTLLYDVSRHHWELLLEEATCLKVIGWLSGPTATE